VTKAAVKKNDSMADIAAALREAGSILLFPHILMDGDAIGSAAALCLSLRAAGHESWVVIEDQIAANLAFLAHGTCLRVEEAAKRFPHGADLSLCIDCGEESRFPARQELYRAGRRSVCLDHHPTSAGIADLNYIDPAAAATGEIVYDLLTAGGLPLDRTTAGCLFAAIATDTGNFTYSNTTSRSHEITVALMDCGIDVNAICVQLYESIPLAKLRLEAAVFAELELIADGRAAIAAVTREMLQRCGARMEDTDGLVERMRSLRGVQIAVLLKEVDAECIKAAMRAKTHGDVAAIACRHGGGGHVKAAGCTLHDNLAAVRSLLGREVEEALAGAPEDGD
jgi:phosphoesterase RecJ-like protein